MQDYDYASEPPLEGGFAGKIGRMGDGSSYNCWSQGGALGRVGTQFPWAEREALYETVFKTRVEISQKELIQEAKAATMRSAGLSTSEPAAESIEDATGFVAADEE